LFILPADFFARNLFLANRAGRGSPSQRGRGM